jgi:hypothetical protein
LFKFGVRSWEFGVQNPNLICMISLKDSLINRDELLI